MVPLELALLLMLEHKVSLVILTILRPCCLLLSKGAFLVIMMVVNRSSLVLTPRLLVLMLTTPRLFKHLLLLNQLRLEPLFQWSLTRL